MSVPIILLCSCVQSNLLQRNVCHYILRLRSFMSGPVHVQGISIIERSSRFYSYPHTKHTQSTKSQFRRPWWIVCPAHGCLKRSEIMNDQCLSLFVYLFSIYSNSSCDKTVTLNVYNNNNTIHFSLPKKEFKKEAMLLILHNNYFVYYILYTDFISWK
jgi:hypothetical protein